MLPNPAFNEPAEPFLTSDESACEPNDPKAGVVAWANFLVENVGGGKGRIMGPCNGRSGHAAGRAFDWMVSALDPVDKAKADAVIEWLLANDAEMFRRVGLAYIIWNKKIWSAGSKIWKPYDGFAADGSCPSPPCRNPHTDHVHFSFNWPGAAGETSWYRWLEGSRPVEPPAPVPWVPARIETRLPAMGAALLVGVAAGFGAVVWWGRR